MAKILIFDSGPLINLAMNGLLHLLEKLKQNFNGKFIITESVKEEVYDRPINIKRFELEALQIQSLIEKKVLELPEAINIHSEELESETNYLLNEINRSFKAENQWINLVSKAEVSCLALSLILSKKGINNIIAIDERTARLICEKPENLAELMSKKLNKRISIQNAEIRKLQGIKFIRSPELVYVAYKKGLTDIEGKKALEALIYATKFKGSSISFEEAEELKKL